MTDGLGSTGWMIEGLHAMLALWAWLLIVVLHGLWRSVAQPDPDAIRPSGPIE